MENAARKDRLLAWKTNILRHVWLAPIVLVALWFRLAGLSGEHLYGDEAEYAIVGRYLSRDFDYLSYPQIGGMGAMPFVSQPPLVLYVMAVSMRILGATDFAAILPSVLLGVGTVIAVYALGARLGGRAMGAGAALLLAVLPFHVEMSRRAMLDVGYAFFLVLMTYFLVAWVQDRRRHQAVWAGVGAAGACLSKLPGVLAVPIALTVFGIVLGVVVWHRVRGRTPTTEVKETLLQGGLGATPVVAGGLLYFGLLWYLRAIGDLWVKLTWQLGRVDSSMGASSSVGGSHGPAFYFTHKYFSFQAQMGDVVFALAAVGLAVPIVLFLASRGRRLDHLVVPIAVGILLAFFLYSERKQGFYLLPFAPYAALLVAYAGHGLHRMLAWAGLRLVPSRGATLGPAALALGLVLVALPAYSAAAESYEDFVLDEGQEQYFGYGLREAAEWIHEEDPEAGQYGTLLGRFALLWYNEQPTYHWYQDHTYLEEKVRNGELKYIVYETYLDLAHDEAFMQQLINKYNGKAVQTFRDGWGEVTVFELNP